MFFDPELMRKVYSLYLNGLAVDEIQYHLMWLEPTDYGKITIDDINDMIDIMNKHF